MPMEDAGVHHHHNDKRTTREPATIMGITDAKGRQTRATGDNNFRKRWWPLQWLTNARNPVGTGWPAKTKEAAGSHMKDTYHRRCRKQRTQGPPREWQVRHGCWQGPWGPAAATMTRSAPPATATGTSICRMSTRDRHGCKSKTQKPIDNILYYLLCKFQKFLNFLWSITYMAKS